MRNKPMRIRGQRHLRFVTFSCYRGQKLLEDIVSVVYELLAYYISIKLVEPFATFVRIRG